MGRKHSLTPEQVEIIQKNVDNVSTKKLAQMFSVSVPTIYNARNNKKSYNPPFDGGSVPPRVALP